MAAQQGLHVVNVRQKWQGVLFYKKGKSNGGCFALCATCASGFRLKFVRFAVFDRCRIYRFPQKKKTSKMPGSCEIVRILCGKYFDWCDLFFETVAEN